MSLAVVTGAASGMGQATVWRLVADGWRVLGIDRVACAPTEALDPVAVDVTDRDAVVRAVGDFASAHGPIELVVNVAGIYPPSTLETYTEDLYRRVFDVNVLGTLNVTAATVPHMSGGCVVNFASVDAFAVSPGQLLYGASKAAVVMLTKELAVELAPQGIRVNAIAPGWVDTPGNAATGRMDSAAASIPLGRVASPDEIAGCVAWLAGRDAGFVSGETIVMSGADVMR